MLLQILALLACSLAAILQWAALRSPETSNLRILVAARRINSVGLSVAALYIGYQLWEFQAANTMLCLICGVYALSQILFAMHTFFEPSCTNRLMARAYRKDPSNEATLT